MTVTETLVAGRYRIGPCLGTGGMGRVWLARDELLRRDVAIKEIALPFGLTDEEREEMRARTLREARAAARLSHPNVVRTYDVQPGDERPWIVMEYVPSRSLLQVIKENGPLPAKDVAGIGLAVLSALDAAYRAGVHHRDIKPSNVLIADDGRVLLTDFGAAVVDEGEGALTQTGIILGSPRYIAPERAATGISTLESDLWSLGATLYEAVEGRAPYTRETTIAMLVALATEKPDPVDRAGPLKPVIQGLLQKKPENRMKPAEVEEKLRRIADVQNAVRLHQVPPQRVNGKKAMPPVPVSPARAANGNGAPVRGEASLSLNALALPSAPDQTGSASRAAPLAPPPVSAPPHTGWSVSRDRRRWALAGGALVAAIAVLAAAFLLNGMFGSGKNNADAGTAGTPTFVPSAPVVPAQSTSPAAVSTALPAGYKWYNSKGGFHVAWPNGWGIVNQDRTSVFLCNPGGPPLVRVREWTPSDPDLYLALRREETAAGMSKYKRLRMVVSPTQNSAEWEYTYTDAKMGAMHALDRVVVANGRSYIIDWQTPARKWTDYMGKMSIVVDRFRPATTQARQSVVPSGFVLYKSAGGGFQFARPAKWVNVGETATSIAYCSPGKPPLVSVRKWASSTADLSTALAQEAQKLKGYKRIAVDSVPGGQAAALEYTFIDKKMGPLHAVDRAYVTASGTFLLQWRTLPKEWTQHLAYLGVVTRSVSPTK